MNTQLITQLISDGVKQQNSPWVHQTTIQQCNNLQLLNDRDKTACSKHKLKVCDCACKNDRFPLENDRMSFSSLLIDIPLSPTVLSLRKKVVIKMGN